MTDASKQWTVQPKNTGGDYGVKANGYGSLVTTFFDGADTRTQLLLRSSATGLGDNVAHGTLVAAGVSSWVGLLYREGKPGWQLRWLLFTMSLGPSGLPKRRVACCEGLGGGAWVHFSRCSHMYACPSAPFASQLVIKSGQMDSDGITFENTDAGKATKRWFIRPTSASTTDIYNALGVKQSDGAFDGTGPYSTFDKDGMLSVTKVGRSCLSCTTHCDGATQRMQRMGWSDGLLHAQSRPTPTLSPCPLSPLPLVFAGVCPRRQRHQVPRQY